MAPKKKAAKIKSSPGGNDPSSGDEPISLTNRGHAEIVGFFDADITPSLYGLWRRDVAQLIKETGILGLQKAGTERWSTLHHHAAGLATMPPRGMINYSEESEILHAVNMLC